MSNHDDQGKRSQEKDQQELSVRHGQDALRGTSVTSRMTAGYRDGIVASVMAAVSSSVLAAVAGWPSPLEPSAEALMQWTPLPMAEYFLQHLGGMARPAALLGALAIFMLCGGLAGVLARAPAASSPSTIIAWLASAGFLTYIMVFLLRPSMIWPDVWLVGAFFCSLAILGRRSTGVTNRRQFFERTAVIMGSATVLVSLFSIEPVLQAIATRKLFPFRPVRGLA
jgi:hypothetical protein